MNRDLVDGQRYVLPNGTVVLARFEPPRGWRLYRVRDGDREPAADYGVDRDGQITFQGKLTRWTVHQLAPTYAALPADRPAPET